MARKRKVANLTALAVLSVVAARPMHPYEIGQAMRGWGKDRDMKIKWGSLYSVVAALAKHGFIAEAGTARDGNRPERTVYRITAEGHAELVDWARELLTTVDGDHARFRAGLSVAVVLPPEEVAAILRERIAAMEARAAAEADRLAGYAGSVSRIFLVEDEYAQALDRSEIDWARSYLEEIDSGTLPGLDQWRAFHDTGGVPDGLHDAGEAPRAP